jgi:prolyl-tRNA synthetase
MRYSRLLGRTSYDAPHDADSINAKMLTQGGFIDKVAAGIYNILPLGLRVLQKINQIIREEMNGVDGQELLMPALHPIEFWYATGRDKTMHDILYRTRASGDREFVFGPSHEEMVTPLVKKFTRSYKDLPYSVYQLQTKFRDEPRAKSGLLRGREFGMKDMYSFHTSSEDLDAYYERVKEAYLRVYERCGLRAYVVKAGGGAFTNQFTHEFSVVTPAGEDTILVCDKCKTAENSEIARDMKRCETCGGDVRVEKAVEAGNIFKLGTKYSEAYDLFFTDKDGHRKLVIMGCYGIGNTRMVGTIVEASHDEKGIIWPLGVAPYTVSLVGLAGKDEHVMEEAEGIYREMQRSGIEVLFDDRDESPGKKFTDADLIGLPLRIVVSGRSLEKGGVEWKLRGSGDTSIIPLDEVVSRVKDLR